MSTEVAPNKATRGLDGTRHAIAWTVLVSLLVAHASYFHFGTYMSASRALTTAVVGVVVAFLMLVVPVRWMLARVREQTRRYVLVVLGVSLLAGMAATWLVPVPPAPGRGMALEIMALGTKAPAAVSSEVWVRMEVDGRSVGAREFEAGPGWTPKDAFMLSVPSQQPARLRWSGEVADYARLAFVSHSWSGQVRVTWNGRERFIDLYAKDGGPGLVVNLIGADPTNDHLAYPDRTPLQRWVQFADGLLIGMALWFVFNFLVARGRTGHCDWRPRLRLRSEILLHATPTIVVGALLTAIYFPALMTSDSLDQWRQSGSGNLSDAHPITYTLSMTALRVIWDSPALLAMLQAAFMGLACGSLIAVLRRGMQGRFWIAHVGAWLVALHPFVALTNVTIWKDVPYAASVIGLTAFVIGALYLRQPDLRKPSAIALFVFLAVVCMTTRHNGPPVGFMALVLLWFVQPIARKQWFVAAFLTVGLFAFVKGPLNDVVGATRAHFSFALYTHHIAAHLAHGHLPAQDADRNLLQSIDSSDPAWRYDCATLGPTLFDPHFNGLKAAEARSDLLRIWFEQVRERPGIDVQHVVCSTGLIWRVLDLERDPLYLSGYALWAPEGRVRWIISAPGDPVESSYFPEAAEELGQALLDFRSDLFWRPALFMYVFIFAVLVAWRRANDARILILLVLPGVHTLMLGVAIVAQDARYQLPIYAVALLATVQLITVPRLDRSDKRGVDVSRERRTGRSCEQGAPHV